MEKFMKNPTSKGAAEWFTGDVWVDTLAKGHGGTPLSVAHVHFSPGARTAWHSHAVGQTLYLIEGEGRVQSRGEPVVTLRAGDTVFTPGGEWHWHGAAPDHLMTHLAVSEGDPTWGDDVTEIEYGHEPQD